MVKKIFVIYSVVLSFVYAFDQNGYKQKCMNGDIEACYVLADHLTTGENAKNQDSMEEGVGYMRKACVFGKGTACDRLGEIYFQNKSYGAARPYLIEACKKGVKSACEAVGTIYRDGHDVKPDDVLSRRYYEKACALKSGNACYNVAIIYRGGFGVAKNRSQEKAFYQKGCEAGLKAACDRYTQLDNEDKGIETGIWSTIKGWFK